MFTVYSVQCIATGKTLYNCLKSSLKTGKKKFNNYGIQFTVDRKW